MSESDLIFLFGDVRLVEVLLWGVALTALLFFLGRIKLWPRLKAFVKLVDALGELPAKLDLVDEIHHEVMPNTGTSLNDSVRRVEKKVDDHVARCEIVCGKKVRVDTDTFNVAD